jgi:hypothetical protein
LDVRIESRRLNGTKFFVASNTAILRRWSPSKLSRATPMVLLEDVVARNRSSPLWNLHGREPKESWDRRIAKYLVRRVDVTW